MNKHENIDRNNQQYQHIKYSLSTVFFILSPKQC